jgi:hypothetical protein
MREERVELSRMGHEPIMLPLHYSPKKNYCNIEYDLLVNINFLYVVSC